MRRNLSFWVVAIALLGTAQTAQAQDTDKPEVWTLNQCISYAKEHNIQVQTQQVSSELADIELDQAKASRFPTLNFSSNFGVSFQNATTYNDFMEQSGKTSYSDNFGLNSGVTIYNGGKINNTIKQEKVQSQAAKYDVEQSQMEIEVSVTQAYLQLLYSYEALNIAELSADLSQKSLDRGNEMLAAGSISKGDLAQLQSQAASDRYNVTTSKNSVENARLQLKQLLELDLEDQMNVEFPTIDQNTVLAPVPPLAQVYQTALEELPQMKSSALGLESAELAIAIAKAGHLPTISASAGMNTGTNSAAGTAYFEQLGTKLNENVGLSLSIPIFSGKQVRTNVSRAKLQSTTTQLQDQSTRKQLLSTIEQLHNDATAAQSQYISANEQLEAANVSLEIVTEQFHAGLKNTIELITEENNYRNALSSQLQAKFKAVLALKLLEIYQNRPIYL